MMGFSPIYNHLLPQHQTVHIYSFCKFNPEQLTDGLWHIYMFMCETFNNSGTLVFPDLAGELGMKLFPITAEKDMHNTTVKKWISTGLDPTIDDLRSLEMKKGCSCSKIK